MENVNNDYRPVPVQRIQKKASAVFLPLLAVSQAVPWEVDSKACTASTQPRDQILSERRGKARGGTDPLETDSKGP